LTFLNPEPEEQVRAALGVRGDKGTPYGNPPTFFIVFITLEPRVE